MRGTKAGGFGTLMALFICALLLLVGMVLLSNVMSASTNARSETIKAQIAESAHAGLDMAMETLDMTPTANTCASDTLQGYDFTCGMVGSFQSTTVQSKIDPCTGNSISIAKGLVIGWGRSATPAGERTVCVEALLSQPSSGVQMPDNAVTANGNITGGGHMTINTDKSDKLNPHDADVYANGYISNFTTSVGGNTYAVGADSQPGWDGKTTHSGAPPVLMPPAWQIAALQTYVIGQAQAGTRLTAAQFIANGTKTYSGNVYIDGNVDMTGGTATFTGADVYVNGFLCLSSGASVVNKSGGVIMVGAQYAQAGNSGGYQIGSNPKGVLAVMGSDATPSCGASNGPYAASISGNATTKLGVVWTAYGSIHMAGNGNVTGMIVSGKNAVFDGGGSGGSFTFDSSLASLVIPMPGLARILAYAEY